MKDCLLVYSGGLDSTTMLYEYKDRIALALSFNYGSKHNEREIEYAQYHCQLLGIKHHVIELSFIRDFFKSSLLKGGDDIPTGEYNEKNMHSTVVPFRNGIMLSVAAGMAENEGLQYIMLANHAGDHTIYPDCRPQFVESMDKAVQAGTWNCVKLLAPYTNITKADIARKGKLLGIDYSMTWSCYKGEQYHCGTCGTCLERIQALKEAGINDTTIYQN